jgi:hypothetical protein
MNNLKLTKQERQLLADALFAYRCRKLGESLYTDENLFPETASQAEDDVQSLFTIHRKLYGVGAVNHLP